MQILHNILSIITAGWDLDDLDRDLSDVWNIRVHHGYVEKEGKPPSSWCASSPQVILEHEPGTQEGQCFFCNNYSLRRGAALIAIEYTRGR